jgi:DNA-binding NtrC family response regulator
MSEAKRVFVVDDEPVISATFGLILRLRGYETYTFSNPLDALWEVTQSAPDILLADVVMPEMSGIDLAIQVSQSHPECRIMLLSGQASCFDMLAGARERGYHFPMLKKPIYPDTLLAALEQDAMGRTHHQVYPADRSSQI